MGNVKSCCASICPASKDDDDEYGERTRILADPTDSSGCDDPYATGRCSADPLSHALDDPLRHTHNYNWNNTLMHLAQNLIDVSSSYVPSIEPSDLIERQKLYTARLAQVKTVFALRSRQLRNRRASVRSKSDQIDVRRLQHVAPVSDDERRLITELALRVSDAFYSGYQVELDEQLVVQFNP
jgi:hypothetical protein